MKLIITADWHIRATRPRCRIDIDWMQTQRKALTHIVEIAKEKEATVMVVGDLFHSNSDTNFECIQLIQKMADELGGLYILAGNHDLPFHNSENIEKSAIGVLLNSSNVHLIKDFFSAMEKSFSASNFDEQDYKNANFVFKHTLVFPDEKSIPPNCKGMIAKEMLDEFPNSKWIFSGDYHHNFHYLENGRYVVNPGCLLRQASDMKDYVCGVYYVDTDRESCEFIELGDDEDLVDDSYILNEDERNERIDLFVDKLKTTKITTLDFVENVKNAMLVNDFDSDFVDAVNEFLGV